VACWESLVRHDDVASGAPAVCVDLVRRGNLRVTQPARVILGGSAVLGHPDQVTCRGCGGELRVLLQELRD
jgi:hypothetical protein